MSRSTCAALMIGLVSVMSVATQADEKATSKVAITMVIPETVASIPGNTLEIRLYKYDPRIAGKPADLVEKIERKKVAHTKGKATTTKLVIGAKAALDARKNYYVTLFLLKDGKRTHIGEKDGKRGLCKVLTGGNPNKVKMVVRSVRRPR